MRLIIYHAAVHMARADDLCQELCDFDGPSICSEGSELIIDLNGDEICTNYFYIRSPTDSVEIAYVTEEYFLHRARVVDIPAAIAARMTAHAEGSLRIAGILALLG